MAESFEPHRSTQKPTVLVIDDEAGPRDALKVILRPFFNIQSAESAQADIEVIIITGYGSLRSAMEGIRHGAAGYLLKPFNVTELITLVNQTLEKKPRLDYLRRYLQSSNALWGSAAECAQAWQELRAGYEAIGRTGGPTLPWGDDTADLLPMLSDLLEAKDRQLLNHCSRVSFYATLLGNRTNLTVNEQKSLALGAFLHDIGKIGKEAYRFADDEIVATDSSHELRQHPEIGA